MNEDIQRRRKLAGLAHQQRRKERKMKDYNFFLFFSASVEFKIILKENPAHVFRSQISLIVKEHVVITDNRNM